MGVIVQYDDVTVSLIPSNAVAVLGYTDGRFANRSSMSAAFPKALKTFLTVSGGDLTADGVDSETGDASTEAVVSFCHQLVARGVKPVVYTFLANMEGMLQAIFASGIPREHLKIMCAHVTGVPHLCGPQCGFGLTVDVDATQWTFTAHDSSLDESLCLDTFWERSLVPPAPVDPHGYLRFHDSRRRGHVELYDKLRPHPIRNRKKLGLLKRELKRGADHIALEVIKGGKPHDWATDSRGWRYQQMIKRAHGKRLVK